MDTKTKTDTIDSGCKHVLCTRVDPDGACAALAAQDGSVTLLDVATGKPRKRIEAHGKPTRSLSFSSDGRVLISASDDGTIVSAITHTHAHTHTRTHIYTHMLTIFFAVQLTFFFLSPGCARPVLPRPPRAPYGPFLVGALRLPGPRSRLLRQRF